LTMTVSIMPQGPIGEQVEGERWRRNIRSKCPYRPWPDH
jgi:hypothetical protein